ncbi:WD repeat-containing protein 43 [Amyelois transitella]|uniref:WD repeat-containing protein 43 n=1 Tax=Amyelois transitella TaxID=680683 RepID=UPI00299019E6|nr:WD repeat-containing protein 43 [Amyelois transitella]
MGESAFSEDGKYYSNISQDGRLRIWDTETNVLKQEYTPDLHLTSPPSCLKWVFVGISTGTQPKTKRKSSDSETQCIALGTSSGKILIYSVTQAKVDHVLKEEKSGNFNSFITSVDWHRKYGLFSCNKSNYVYNWDLSNGKIRNKYNVIFDSKNKQGNSISAIKIVPHNLNTPARYLITASWQVCLWRLHNNDATIVRNLGHNATQNALLSLCTLNKSCWLIVGALNERLLSFWDVTIAEDQPQVNGDQTPSKKQRKLSSSSSPTYNFVLEDAPRYVDVTVREDENGTALNIGATTRSGVMHYYNHMLNGASAKPLKPSVTIQVTSPAAHPLPLQCCKVLNSDILIGYSNGTVTTFERITPELKSKTQVLIRGDSVKKNRRSSTIENKLKQDDSVTYVEPMGGVVGRKRSASGGQIEVPMEARLENLALDPKSRSKAAVNQNLTKLLMQGLHSKDKELTQMVLLKNDPAVANRTVASLPVDCVPLLLQHLLIMANRKTTQCASVCTWIKAVVRSHAALLIASSSSNNAAHSHLAQLLAVFTHRRSHLCQLLNLRGRLDLTMSQRKTDNEHSQEAVLEYNDDSTSEDMEVEKYHSDSDQSWDDERDRPDDESDDE